MLKNPVTAPEAPRVSLGRLLSIGLLAGAAACGLAAFWEQVASKAPAVAQENLLISSGRSPVMGFGGGGEDHHTPADIQIDGYQQEIDAHYAARNDYLEGAAGLILVVTVGASATAIIRRLEARIPTIPEVSTRQ